MAPLRRYLRITQFSVLEVRIYLHKPSDIAWLLSSRDNVLQRIIAAVKPHVLPKLREEVENAKNKKGGKKKKGVKDVAESEDFEVSIFLKEASTRHSLLTKRKKFQDKPRIKSTGSKLTGWLNNQENPIDVEDEQRPSILREEDDEDGVNLRDVPEAGIKTKKKRSKAKGDAEDDALFVSSSDDDFFQTQRAQGTKRRKRRQPAEDVEQVAEEEEEVVADQADVDDKKKLALDTSYDGFSIYGRVLCLIVKRKGGGNNNAPVIDGLAVGGSQMMEQWVSTQANADAWRDEDAPEG